MFNGGYIMLDLRESSEKVLKQASICLNQDKPILVYDANGKGTFMTIASDGASGYILTGADSTVVIASDGTVTAYSGVLMENIKDKDGHFRFIEGDGEVQTITGFTSTYCKWSLSGSHLMLVLAGTFANNTTIEDVTLAKFKLPQWILDKIFPVYSDNVEVKNYTLYAVDWSAQSTVILEKKDTDCIKFNTSSNSFTLTAERKFRVQCDLLIDNE